MMRYLYILIFGLLCITPAFAASDAENVVSNNAYNAILAQREFQFDFLSFLRGIVGMASLIFIAWLVSSDRKHINWSTVFKALLLQFIMALSIILFPFVKSAFEFVGHGFIAVLNWTNAGTTYLFGPLMSDDFGYIFALRVIPPIIFFSAITSLLFYLGVLQKIVWAMGWLLTKFMNLSGAESLSCVGNVFLGQTEAPIMVKAYIPKMTKSEIVLIMVSGMATMAGGVLAVYISLLGGGDPALELEFAKHLLSASVMAAPGAIAFAKIIMPQTEKIDNSVTVSKDSVGKNVLDAISTGTSDGLRLAVNVAAMLLVFNALIAGFNHICLAIGDVTHLNGFIASISGGQFDSLSMEYILSVVFSPIIWLTGIPAADIHLASQVLGEKIIMTEFISFQNLAQMMQSGAFTSEKSIIMTAYIVCGFSNFASIGILIGGVGGMAPNQRPIMSANGFKALLASTLVALMSAIMIGMFI
ncbi:MAG: nucleoside transporter C-terminal domain-containing protein [Rikenellaceae bacterium]